MGEKVVHHRGTAIGRIEHRADRNGERQHEHEKHQKGHHGDRNQRRPRSRVPA